MASSRVASSQITSVQSTHTARSGLEGVIAATTTLSKSDGETGQLVYRGYDIHELAQSTTFEEIAYLLWFGHLPNVHELAHLRGRLIAERTIPKVVLTTLRGLTKSAKNVVPMDALRTAISAWGAMAVHGKPTLEAYLSLIKSFVTANGYYIEFSNSSMIAEEQAKVGEGEEQAGQNKQGSQLQERQENNDNDDKDSSDIMIIRFNISYKFSQFLGNVYRILLEEFCTIKQFELTETLAFYEYKKREMR